MDVANNCHVLTKSSIFKSTMMLFLGLLLSTNLVHAALSATTVNTIQGTAPYLTFDDGTTKVTSTDELLGIELSDGTSYTKLTNTSTAAAPIELPVANQTFADIKTLIPAPLTSVSLSTLIGTPYNRWGDDDGDGQEVSGITATGTLSVSLRDVNNVAVNLGDTLDGCNSPYKLTLSSTAGMLTTQYGAPRNTSFTASSETYYIKPKIAAPYVCYVKPNINQNYGTNAAWDSVNGFEVQDVGIPSSNFPRTGFNGAYFNMTVVGETASNVIAANGPTVNGTSGATNIRLNLTVQSTNVVRVTLSGPSSGQKVGQPSPAAVNMPTEFNLYSDAAKTNKIYSFALRQWYISKSGNGGSYPTVQNYCTGLPGSYRVPKRVDYTNSPVISLPFCPGNGADTGGESCKGGTYTRAIDGGIFAEWGYTYDSYYTSSDWEDYIYWTSEPYNSGSTQYGVNSGMGIVGFYGPTVTGPGAACVSP